VSATNETARAQPDFALLALYRRGGAEQMVDLEHVAVEAYKLAPELFKWRFYDYPSVETCRMALRHGNERAKQALVLAGDAGKKRMLTAAGVRRVREFQEQHQQTLGAEPASTVTRPVSRDLLRMEKHPAVDRWRLGGVQALTAYDLADLLNFQPGSPRRLVEDRLRMTSGVAERWQRSELLRFLSDVTEHLDRILEGEAS